MIETAAGGRRNAPRRLRALVNVAVSAALLAVLAWLVDLRSLGAILASASMLLVAAAVLAAFADRVLIIAKWLPLLRAQDVEVPLARREAPVDEDRDHAPAPADRDRRHRPLHEEAAGAPPAHRPAPGGSPTSPSSPSPRHPNCSGTK